VSPKAGLPYGEEKTLSCRELNPGRLARSPSLYGLSLFGIGSEMEEHRIILRGLYSICSVEEFKLMSCRMAVFKLEDDIFAVIQLK
jgi:hypothetical protein